MGFEQFVLHNVVAVVRELALLGPIAAAVWWWRGRRAGSSQKLEARS
jgi:hypothetical protein